jgi:ribosomal protein L37AE/L43A
MLFLGIELAEHARASLHQKCGSKYLWPSHKIFTTHVHINQTREEIHMLDAMTARPGPATQCARCGDPLVAPEWSEHVNERCVRHLWSCEACGYEFETAVYLQESTA